MGEVSPAGPSSAGRSFAQRRTLPRRDRQRSTARAAKPFRHFLAFRSPWVSRAAAWAAASSASIACQASFGMSKVSERRTSFPAAGRERSPSHLLTA